MTTEETIKKIEERINNFSTEKIREKAKIVSPNLMTKDKTTHYYECKEDSGATCFITVELPKNNQPSSQIFSFCTCSYKGAGMCEHQVASLNVMMSNLKNNEATKSKKSVSKLDGTTIIECDKGKISEETLNTIPFNNSGFYYNDAVITDANRKSIYGSYDDYRTKYQLKLTYNKRQDIATLDCTCGATKPCSHKAMFLEKFSKIFGLDFFSNQFEKDFKAKVLEGKGLTGKVKFDDVFSLDITPKGVKVHEKVPNVRAIDDVPLKLVDLNRESFFLPPVSKRRDEYRAGLCIEFHDYEYYNVTPIIGKYNPKKQEITSGVERVDEYSFDRMLSKLTREVDRRFFVQTFQLIRLFRYNRKLTDLEDLKLFINVFSELVPFFDDVSLYLYNSTENCRFSKKYLVDIRINSAILEPVALVTESDSFYNISFGMQVDGETHLLSDASSLVGPIGILIDNQLYVFKNALQAKSMLTAHQDKELNIIKSGTEKLKQHVLQPLSNQFTVLYDKLNPVDKVKEIHEMQVYLSDIEGEYIVFQPLVSYGEQSVVPCSSEMIWSEHEDLDYMVRDEQAESDFLSLIQNLHPSFKNNTEYFYISPEKALHEMWLMDTIQKLQDNNVVVYGINNLKSIRYNLNKPSFNTVVSSGTDWFDLKIEVSFGNQTVDLKSLQKAIINKSKYVALKDGTLGLLPEKWIEKYKKYFQTGQVKKDKIEISNYQFNIIDELYEELTNTPKFLQELYQKKQRLLNLSELKPVAKPRGLKAQLRPYQKEGLNWLVFLHENKLGGCLADDMGLGKTLQTIAFILFLKQQTPAKQRIPHLVIAPTSLMFNWQAELKKFAPSLNVLVYTGQNREELRKQFSKHDVILSTYGTVINDIDFHQTQHYGYVILDESQAIKNPQSQRFKAVRLLKCENRLALTGTPIENNTFDLYSQFNFINPGIFGSVKHFKANFSDAIDKDQDPDTAQLLSRMIHPFIMRRTKAQVAKELPDKTEGVIYCEMGVQQQKVYDEFKKYFRQKLLEQIEEEGVKKSQMYILQGLTKLRQICNSTALADSERDYGNYSVKMDELVRHLNEKVNKHKVLVFSQFVGMLQLIQERLIKEGIQFEYLDGQTRDREARVNNFQENKNIRVFLISLKAGGTGLNLTEADYVYLIDPWWNPAVENQAIDRCYRIGQDKKVMAYRMICKDTIEEKIVQLQEKKKTVASEVIQVDIEKKTFDKADVERFFGN